MSGTSNSSLTVADRRFKRFFTGPGAPEPGHASSFPGFFFIGLLLTAAVSPSIPLLDHWLPIYDERRVLVTGWLVFAGLLTALRHRDILANPALLPLSLVGALGTLGLVVSTDPRYAGLELATYVTLITAILLWGKSGLDETAIRRMLLPALAVSAIAYGIVTLFAWAAGWMVEGHRPPWPEPLHNFINRRFLNDWQTWLLPLMPAILFMHLPYCRQSLHRALAITYFSLLWALLFYTFGRAALFAQIGCLLLIPALFGRKGVHWTGLQLIAGLGGLALLFLAFGINPFDPESPTSRLVSLDDEARLALWATSIDLISRHPLIGIGPMQFAAIPGVPNAHPHNLPLQIAVEWGIPAALLLGGTLVWSGWKWIAFARRRASDTDCPRWEAFLLMSLTASIAAATATSLVAGTAHTPMSQLMLIIVVGTAYALYRRNHPADVGKWRRLVAIWLCAILFATIWLAGFTTYELLHYLGNDLQGTEHVGGGWIPRFWRVGKLTPSWEGN